MKCRLDTCENKLFMREHCQRHYGELLGTPALPRLTSKTGKSSLPCTKDGCSERQYAKGYCRKHYTRLLNTGSVEDRPLPEHGTLARYSRDCRCEPCVDARRQYMKEWAAKALDRLACGSTSKYTAGCRCNECLQAFYASYANNEHGTPGRYSGGCRCEACRTAYSEYKARYYSENERYRAANRARAANLRAAAQGCEGELTADDLLTLYEIYPYCLVCRTDEDLSIDHVVPLTAGGSNTLGNLQILCRTHNMQKHQRTIDYRPDKGQTLAA